MPTFIGRSTRRARARTRRAVSVQVHAQAVRTQTAETRTAQAQTAEHVAEVRIHGNHTTPDVEIIKLTGITLGESVTDETLPQVAKRLRDSGRFKDVDVLKRYRSLTDASQISLIVIVHEYPSIDPGIPGAPLPPVPGPIRRLLSQTMFLPIVSYSEGYGFTYGARASFVDVLGEGGRVSVPLTWGGTRRAAVELEKTFDDETPISRVLSRVTGGAGISRRENPHFELPDTRQQLWGRIDKDILRELRVGGGVELDRRRLRLARRADHTPRQPLHHGGRRRDGGYAARSDLSAQRRVCADGLGAAEFQQRAVDQSLSQRSARLSGGVIGQSVLAVRALHQRVDRPLPPLRAGAARRRIDPARFSRRLVRWRQPVRLIGRTARAAQLADGRRPTRCDSVCRHGCGLQPWCAPARCHVPSGSTAAASSCWRRCSSSISTSPTASTIKSASTS